MHLRCSDKRLADAQPKKQEKKRLSRKSLDEVETKIPLVVKGKNKEEDQNEDELNKAFKVFLEAAEYVEPVCLGYRYAFPDGDYLCENCPRYLISDKVKEQIESYKEFIQKKYSLFLKEAEEQALLAQSCKYLSDKNIKEHYDLLLNTEGSIRERFPNDDLLDTRIKKTLEPLILKFEREVKEIIEKRKKAIEEIIDEIIKKIRK